MCVPFFTLGKHTLTLEDTRSGERCLQGTTKDGAEVRRFSSILTFPLEWMQPDFSDVGCLAVSCTYRGRFHLLSNSRSVRRWISEFLSAFLPEHSEEPEQRSSSRFRCLSGEGRIYEVSHLDRGMWDPQNRDLPEGMTGLGHSGDAIEDCVWCKCPTAPWFLNSLSPLRDACMMLLYHSAAICPNGRGEAWSREGKDVISKASVVSVSHLK